MTTTTPDSKHFFLKHINPMEAEVDFADMGSPVPTFVIREPAARPASVLQRTLSEPGFHWSDPKHLGQTFQTYYGGPDEGNGPWPAKSAKLEAWENAVAAMPSCVTDRLYLAISSFSARFASAKQREVAIASGN